jgi:predicted transcriptional regulator
MTHVSLCKGKKNFDAKKELNPTHGIIMEAQMNLQKLTEIMADFLKEGEQNPQVKITRKGFLYMFLA